MTINDLLRERLISKLGLDPDSVGSINDLLYAYLLDPDSGGGGLDPEDLDTEVTALIQQNSGDPSNIRAALDGLYATGEGGLNDAGVAALLEDTDSATYNALGLLLADKANAPVFTAVGTISAVGNTNVSNAGVIGVVTATVSSSLSGTHTLTLQGGAGTAQGRLVIISLTVQSGAGTVEIRNLTSDGTLLGSVVGGDNERTYTFITAFQTTNYLPVKAIEGGVSTDENNALSEGLDGKPFLNINSLSGFVTDTALASMLKYAVVGYVLEPDEDETDLPGDFPANPLYEGGPPPLVFRKKAE